MTPQDPSRTALATSLMRALHTRTAKLPLIDDNWGDRLVPEVARQALPEAALRANAAYADVVLRSRYAEDALHQATASGASQYVLIGAGFDSYAQRRPGPGARLAVFEVDHPATQTLKRHRLAACEPLDPAPPHYIAADLSVEDLGTALQRAPFDASRRAFFSWLGVTVYLTRPANLAALRAIAACAASGSELVFTYVDEAVFSSDDPVHAGFRLLQQRAAAVGETFQSGFDPATLPGLLRDTGFELLEDLNGVELLQRYDAEGVNGLQSNPAAHIVHARVA
jgi:methyltransferase (TIGR00027 family)